MRFGLVVLTALVLSLSAVVVSSAAATGGSPELEVVKIVDYVGPTHSGLPSGPEGCESSSDQYRLIRGGIRWTKDPLYYTIDTSALPSGMQADAHAAVVAAFNTWNAEDHGSTFQEGTYTNPKTGKVSTDVKVAWQSVDGAGGVLAYTSLSFNPKTKSIGSANLVFDSGEKWAVLGSYDCNRSSSLEDPFDIENVAAHEIGHVEGEDHVSSDSALTMYPYAWPSETMKRSLELGDKTGLQALYG